MKTVDFINQLRESKIRLTVKDKKLKCSAPPGTITPEIQAEISSRKFEILAFFESASADGERVIRATPHNRPQPLSFSQQRLWILHQIEPDSAFYHITNVCRLVGPLNIQALRQSILDILERHSALRTRFVKAASEPEQQIFSTETFKMPFIDLQNRGDSEQALEEELTQRAQQPFDLAGDILLRATIFQLEAEEHVLQIVMHHIASDGWSMGIFSRELGLLYDNYANGQVQHLPELPIQYADFAAWQRQWLSGDRLASQLNYWKQKLAGVPSLLALPTDYPRPAQPSYKGSTIPFAIASTCTDGLKALSQRTGTTLFMLLVAAFNVQLYHFTQQDDIVVGSPIANRQHPEVKQLIGFFANTLVLRTDLSGQPSFLALLERVKQTTLEAYDHQDVPFEKLVEILNPKRSPSYNPLFQVMFSFQETTSDMAALPGLAMTPVHTDKTTSKFDLSLSMQTTAQGLHGTWIYNRDLFKAETIQNLAARFQALLDAVVQSPAQEIDTLFLPSEPEQQASRSLENRIATLSPAKRALLEQRLKEARKASTASQPISARPEDAPAVLSSSQENLWLLEQLSPGNGAYNRPSNIHFTGVLDTKALELSLNEIIRRHQILRTCFVQSTAGEPEQVVAPALSIHLTPVDLTHLPSAEQRTEIQRLGSEESGFCFDLSQLPLIRAKLLTLRSDEHVLLLTLHHIIFDGWSMGVLLKELTTCYNAFSNRQIPSLPELPIQYADFAFWQRQQLQLNRSNRQLMYWRKQLSGRLPVLELPTDRPRSTIKSFHGDAYTLLLPKAVKTQITMLCQQENVTLFMLLLAAFKALLYRYTQAEDLIVGSLIAGRNRVETENLIGLFVNTLVLRTAPSGMSSFKDFLQQVRQVALEAYAHQDIPLQKLVEDLQPERNTGHSTLFQVLFQLRNLPGQTVQMQDLQISGYQLETGATAIDLFLEVSDQPDGLACVFKFNADLFERATIQRMSRHFQTLLTGIIADVGQPLCELPLLSPPERHQMLTEWNFGTHGEAQNRVHDTAVPFAPQSCIHTLFEAQAERTPDAIAVVFVDQQLTYRTLNNRANQLAHHLQTLGVGPDELVGLCIERSMDMVVGILAILKAGGAYVPLDPTYPEDRLAFMISDSQSRVLVTKACWLDAIPNPPTQVVCLDNDNAEISKCPTYNPVREATPEHLAYVIYTSGSTGTPKGVMVQHDALVNFTQAAVAEYDITERDRMLQFASISFDAAAEEFYPSLTSGATLVLRSDDMISSSTQFLHTCSDWQITVLDLPTAYWQQLVLDLAATAAELPASLRLVIIGGERVSPDIVEVWQTKVGNYPRLINTYGPTEATVVATAYTIPPEPQGGEIPIGSVLSNVEAYILDQHLQPLPIGVPGELHIGGQGLARGYLDRPQLTAERFIPHPFSSNPQARLYKTGDWVRYLVDGQIDYLGRIDNQVKIRGFRVELGEIEACLAQHPQVQQWVVVAREDQPGQKRLVAYGIAAPEQWPTADSLRQFLLQSLPNYMVPTAFVRLDALPLTPNGKVDQRSLPSPTSHSQPKTETDIPKDELEQRLIQLFEDTLQTSGVGVDDDFFALGGHSLIAVQLFGKIEQEFGRKLPLSTLFQATTVSELAAIIRQKNWLAPWNSLVAIQPHGTKPPIFYFHAGGGNLLVYRDLAFSLGDDQPVYGLQPRGLDGTLEPTRNIKDMADYYLPLMRKVQPHGPYFLAGLSTGGAIAWEIALRLHRKNEPVGMLALFDTKGPGYPELMPLFPRLLSVLVWMILDRIEQIFIRLPQKIYRDGLISTLKEKVSRVSSSQAKPDSDAVQMRARVTEQLEQKKEKYVAGEEHFWEKWINLAIIWLLQRSTKRYYATILTNGFNKQQVENQAENLPEELRLVQAATGEAQKTYRWKAYPGKITYFRATKQPPGIKNSFLDGWSQDAAKNGFEVYDIPGTHSDIVKSPRLAKILKACLEREQAKYINNDTESKSKALE